MPENGLLHVINRLLDKDTKIRERAAETLGRYAEGEMVDERALEPLITLLEDKNPRVRGTAAYALGRYAEQGLVKKSALDKLITLGIRTAECRTPPDAT